MLIYDLHTHSVNSDGTLTPSALVARAAENGVDVLALTDHDTVAGLAEAQQACTSHNIKFVPGIEFSSHWGGRNIHIVGLQVDASDSAIVKGVASQQEARMKRAEIIAHRLEKLGLKNALQGAQKYADCAVVGRPHFARYMVETGMVKDAAQAFRRYLGNGKVGDVSSGWAELGDIVEWINGSGGVAVVAHPLKYKMTRTKLCELLGDFVEAGGQGIELFSGKQSANDTMRVFNLASKFGLSVSVGSDFHSPGNPWQDLAVCGTECENFVRRMEEKNEGALSLVWENQD